MKKIIFIFLIIFLLAGCSVKYNIEIVDDNVYENFTATVDNSDEGSLNYLKNNDFYVQINPEMIKYNKEIEEGTNETSFKYSYQYNLDNYGNSNVLSTCFQGFSVITEDNTYLISTTEGFKCMTSDYSTLIDKIDIVIQSNYKLIETNADEINGYTYIWHVNKNNYKEKSIMLKLNKKRKVLNYKGNLVKNILIFGIPTLLILFAIISLVIRRKKVNKV